MAQEGTPSPATPPSTAPSPSASPEPSTDNPGVRPQDNSDGASAAVPQDAGVAPDGSPSDTSKDERPSRASVPAKPKRSPKVSSPKSLSKGTLEFRVRPYATVFLSGRELGDTPVPPEELPEGNYTVKLVNKSIPKTVTKSIKVVNGETTILRVNLLEE